MKQQQKITYSRRRQDVTENTRTIDSVRTHLSRTKNNLLRDYSSVMGEHAQLLRLALNEAEAVAWASGVPQLVFPLLAKEKAEFAVAWHRRQKAVRRSAAQAEVSFSE
jgi:hypothetical protein